MGPAPRSIFRIEEIAQATPGRRLIAETVDQNVVTGFSRRWQRAYRLGREARLINVIFRTLTQLGLGASYRHKRL